METPPKNNLISNVCDAIASGRNFGGWTDKLLNDAYGYYSKNQIRTKIKLNRKKANLLDKQKKKREGFKVDSEKRMTAAKIKDIRQDPRDSLRQRYS